MLRNAFRELDKDNSGTLEIEELKKAFASCNMTDKEMNELFYKIDFNQDGQLNYTEFLAATVNKQKVVQKNNMKLAFHHFDIDNSGIITADNLHEVFQRQGHKTEMSKVKEMIKECNPQKDNELTYAEFEKMVSDMVDKE
jgi:calcium-dependent protein kinase